ncbi:hypothetical protein DER44DRAFT_797430 [Fusarium oxysporum]|nr:hypothetical protein DER44DRAFT_797430 [Fusarium oxysporum]
MSNSSTEARMLLALQALQNNPKLSVRRAADTYEVVGDHKCETTKSVARCETRWNIPRRWCLYINSSSPTAYFE